MNDVICYHELVETDGDVCYAIGMYNADKWVEKHRKLKAYMEKFGLGSIVSNYLKSKLDYIVLQTNDTLTINRNRDYIIGCGRNARVIGTTNYPKVELRAENGKFVFPRVSGYNDQNFRDLRPHCRECGKVECDGHE